MVSRNVSAKSNENQVGMFMAFPHVMHAQRADHVTSRVCGRRSYLLCGIIVKFHALYYCIWGSVTQKMKSLCYAYSLKFHRADRSTSQCLNSLSPSP